MEATVTQVDVASARRSLEPAVLIQRTRIQFGHRAFSVCGPTILNSLRQTPGLLTVTVPPISGGYQYTARGTVLLLPPSGWLRCRYFVSVLARDARYCKARFCNRMSSVHVCVRPSVTFVIRTTYM